ncbi:hypothetical protein [Phreatobacter stygius]|uniref:Uncharacterized protein n=1 Tax=Phreatobacter stygius TaxID=1940610 RepID=A0A4D7BIE5_9HYPH|nr:hypothetical protein [Phreatobacter stygius]QCI67567.1 hypothetical protein E8M01_27090 [Phreatobacter stygius]
MFLPKFARALRALAAAIVLIVAGTGSAVAQSAGATDRLGLPGPIRFAGVDHALAWTSRPTPNYFKQEYLPAGQRLETYQQMFIVEVSASGATPETAVAAQIAMLDRRKGTDPVVNYQVIRNPGSGEIILDFLMSAPQGDGIVVEWNAYRYVARADGVALFAISRRGYGAAARDFLTALRGSRMEAINALARLDLPALRPRQ